MGGILVITAGIWTCFPWTGINHADNHFDWWTLGDTNKLHGMERAIASWFNTIVKTRFLKKYLLGLLTNFCDVIAILVHRNISYTI